MNLFNKTARRLRTRDRKRSIRLGVELFEERLLLAGIPVTTTVDDGNNSPPTPGSLRAAIIQANNAPNSSIVFQIPITDPGYDSATQTFTITLPTALPAITAPVAIDGTTESTFLSQTAFVAINGNDVVPNYALLLAAGSDKSIISGLEILNVIGAGIVIQSAANTIGGTTAGAGNVLGRNALAGVDIATASATGNVVAGNFIGTDSAGGNLANGDGVIVGSASNTIGGTTAAAANVFGFNTRAGVSIPFATSTQNLVEGNFIGTNASGANLNDIIGVVVSGASNTIGGSTSTAANVISFNSSEGVSVSGPSATGNLVAGNLIVTNALGVLINNASGNTIGGTASGLALANTIAFSDGAAVTVNTGTGNAIRQNLIYDNGVALDNSGIVLTNNGNHNGNTTNAQMAPQIVGATSVPGLTTVQVSLSGFTAGSYELDFYASAPGDTTGTQVQAHVFLGTSTVSTAGSGIVTFATTLSDGQQVTATATSDAAAAQPNDTSQFAAAASLSDPFTVTTNADSGIGSLRQAILDADQKPGTDTILFNIANGQFTISPATPLPAMDDPVSLDGTSQPGYVGTPLIQIDGSPNSLAGDGLLLVGGSSGSLIRGLNIFGFSGGAGIHLQSDNDVIQGNYVGTDVTGTVAGPGNAQGLFIDNASNNTIGGLMTAGNLLSGNTAGVLISGASATTNLLIGNLIGTDATGTGNLGNGGAGVQIISGANNTIGGTATGAANTIAFNSGNAVTVDTGTGNAIRQNSIFANGVGIVLSNGGNAGQPSPTLTFVNSAGGNTQIQGNVSGFAANSKFTIEFFASAAGDPAGQGQAHLFLGNTSITTDGTGAALIDATLAVSVPVGQTVTATATSPANNTSAFATSLPVVDPFLVTTINDSGSGSLRQAIVNANADTSGTLESITFDITLGTSPYTIGLSRALPPITHPIILDATTQPGFLGAPIIVLDGTGLSGSGLVLGANSDGSRIEGFDIINFTTTGATGIDIRSSNNMVLTNFVGVAPDGTSGPNAAGVLINGSGNTIGGMGASAGNTIADNTGAAVSVNSGNGNAIQQNLIFNNGQGIVLASGTNDGQPAPILTNAISSLGKTIVAGSTSSPGYTGQITLEFFANAAINPSGTSPAFTFLGSVPVPGPGPFSVSLPVSVGVGLNTTATATRTANGTPNDTSPFSLPVTVANPFVVTTTLDNGDNVNPLPGSLRQVIQSVDGNPQGPNMITFAIQGSSPFVIKVNPLAPLPTITAPVTIDGKSESTTVSGAVVEINGGGQIQDGLTLGNRSDGSVIEGLTITGFTSDAILVQSSNNTIGGTATGAGNVIMGNTGDAVRVVSGTGNAILQNVITFTSPARGIVVDTAVDGAPAVKAVASVASATAGLTTIDGSVTGTAAGTYTVAFFASSTTGAGPAAQFLGSTLVTLAAAGTQVYTAMLTTSTSTFNITIPLLASQTVTATVTGPDSSTSTFATGPSTAQPVSDPFKVSNTSDNTVGSWVGSLRLAILNANTQPLAGGADSITFTFNTGSAPFVITAATGLPLPTITVPVSIQGPTSALGAPEVEINGSGQAFDGLILGPGSSGGASSIGSSISGLDIVNFQGAGIRIESSRNVVSGNFIGTDASGRGPMGNEIGVLVSGGTSTTIGGATAGAGNVISGNFTAGIELNGNTVSGIQILGNLIGTDATGSLPVVRPGQSGPLQSLQNAGVVVIGSQGNTIGGDSSNARNLISGNYVGVMLATISDQGNPNLVLGNLIGTDFSGTKSLGNIVGIYINGAAGNQIGGTGPASGNIISGNSSVGVEIYGSASVGNSIEGNTIGLAADGQGVFRDRLGLFTQRYGIYILDSSGNMIGGSAGGAGNVISGNESAGAFIQRLSGNSSGNTIDGNFIGLGPGGGAGPGNAGYGIVLVNAPNNPIGRTGSAANRFGRNGIADVRNFTGPVPGSRLLTAASRGRSRKAMHPTGPARHFRLVAVPKRKGRAPTTDHRR